MKLDLQSSVYANIYEEKKVFDGFQKVILLLLFLMSMDFQNRFFYLAFASFGMMALYHNTALQLPRNVIPTLVLAISLSLFAPSSRNSPLGIIRPFAYPFCVIIGYNLMNGSAIEKKGRQLAEIILVLASGAFSHYLLNMLLNMGVKTQRNTIDVWTLSTRAATGQAALACLMVGGVCALLFCKIATKWKLCCIAILAVIMIYNLQLAGRTLFIFVGIAVTLAFAMRYRFEKSYAIRMKMLGSLTLLLVTVVIFVSVNAFGIVDMYHESNFYDRFHGEFSEGGIADDGRMGIKLSYFQYMGMYMFGGGNIRQEAGYAHDVILDTYDEAGLIAMLAVIILLCSDFYKCVRVYRCKEVHDDIKILFVTVYVLMLFQMMLEPILIGVQWLMASYCVMSGSLAKLYESTERRGW